MTSFAKSVVEEAAFDILFGLAALCNALLPKLVSGEVEVDNGRLRRTDGIE